MTAVPAASKKYDMKFKENNTWSLLSDDQRKPYREKAVEDLLRYKSDYEEYKKIEKLTVTIEQMFDIINATRK